MTMSTYINIKQSETKNLTLPKWWLHTNLG